MRIIQDREEKQSAELYLQNYLLNETSTTEIAIYFSLAGFTRHPFFESSSHGAQNRNYPSVYIRKPCNDKLSKEHQILHYFLPWF